MSLKKSDKSKHAVIPLARTSKLSHKQVAAHLDIGIPTLNQWLSKESEMMSVTPKKN